MGQAHIGVFWLPSPSLTMNFSLAHHRTASSGGQARLPDPQCPLLPWHLPNAPSLLIPLSSHSRETSGPDCSLQAPAHLSSGILSPTHAQAHIGICHRCDLGQPRPLKLPPPPNYCCHPFPLFSSVPIRIKSSCVCQKRIEEDNRSLK